MGRCKTCKWWDGGECDVLGTDKSYEPDTQFEVEVRVSDDHGLGVVLRTGPEFGCVLHEEK